MDIETIGVIGAGSLGRGIACAAALAGYRTILEDNWPATLEQGIAWIEQALAQEVRCCETGQDTPYVALSRLTSAISPEAASREADLIIETAPDEMEVKLELFTVFDRFAKPGAIFATTIKSLSITEIAAITFCPERCVGMRFENLGRKNKLLELIKGHHTSDESLTSCCKVGRRMGMDVVVSEFKESVTIHESRGYNSIGTGN